MRDRITILKDLVLFNKSINLLNKELAQYTWDTETPLLEVSANDFCSVLQRCVENEFSFEELTNWANAIECRDDLQFVNEEIQELIFDLANSEINGKINQNQLKTIIRKIRKAKV